MTQNDEERRPKFTNTVDGLQITFPNGFKLSLSLPSGSPASGADFMVFDPDGDEVKRVDGFELEGQFENSGFVSPERLPVLVTTVALMK